jgi:hypothetical protein
VQDSVTLTASAEDGSAIDQVRAEFKPGELEAKVTFEVPVEMRNQLASVSIDGENSAGATVLLDERWRRRPVGVISTNAESSQPLLTETSYIERALSPYVDLSNGSVADVLKKPLAVMVMTDSATLDVKSHQQVVDWVENGGTLLRFAGPRLASSPSDLDTDLLPVQLRPGERILGGNLSGTKPAKIAPFDENSPFRNIKVPDNVTVKGEILAQPSGDLDEKTWARLEDGTPLVTATQKGKGWVVLVHTTPNTDWSNLSLSGLFVDMTRAIVAHSQGVAGGSKAKQSLPPIKTLDAKGQLADPSASARPLQPESTAITVQNPPGFYGDDSMRQALNMAPAVEGDFKKLAALPENIDRKTYQDATRQTDLSGPLLAGAMALLLIDLLILLKQRNLLPQMPGSNRQNRVGFDTPAPKKGP